ncbi:MAG: hypothetical protein ACYCUM_04490 [Solirubrobacteraceae bacterium]
MSHANGFARRRSLLAIAGATPLIGFVASPPGPAAPAQAGATPNRGGEAATPRRWGEAAAQRAPAQSARTLDGGDTAQLHLVHQHESVLFEQGRASGALAGTMHAKLTVGSLFTGSFTIDTGHGSITGHGSAKPHGTGRYQSFSGTMYVTSGTGSYRHVHGTTALYGTFDRRTFDVVIKTRGRLSY